MRFPTVRVSTVVESAFIEVLEGPREGLVLDLKADTLSIGREPTNGLDLPESAVSRHHCEIRWTGEGYQIQDFGSRNGTRLNGLPVTQSALRDGDEIRVGKSLIRFRSRREGDTQELTAAIDETTPARSRVLRVSESRYASPDEDALAVNERTLRDLRALVEIGRAVNSVRDREQLEETILDCLLEVASADRAAILLTPEDEEPVVMSRDRSGPAAIRMSGTVVRQVLEQRLAVLAADVGVEEDFEAAASLIGRNVRAILAAPLEVFDRILGLIYLESGNPQQDFDEQLLELVTAAANIAASALDQAGKVDELVSENRRLRSELQVTHDMVGSSRAMQVVFEFIGKVAGAAATALIQGESGTGKELVAQAIHRNSPRAGEAFVAVNCAAIPENLIESELFGHEKGAFTGAASQKKGKFELADKGTIFLDEIGELPLAMQGKLLRVLQERVMERVGGSRPIPIDVRVVAATNRDLKEEEKAGRFRQDLRFRLDVVSVRMPPLRERRDDIPLLADFFLAKHAEAMKREVTAISTKAMKLMQRYDWPGNVRELQNAIERAVVMGSSSEIQPEDLPDSLHDQGAADAGGGRSLNARIADAKRRIVEQALIESGGSVSKAAQELDVHANHLSRLIKTLGVKKKS